MRNKFGSNSKFSFGKINFKMHFRHPSEEAEYAIGRLSLEVRAEDRHLRIISV